MTSRVNSQISAIPHILVQLSFFLLLNRASFAQSSWTTERSGFSLALYAVTTLDSLTAVAVGDSGIILKTTDGGKSWKRMNSGTSSRLLDVSFHQFSAAPFTNILDGFAVGENVICQTTNGGETWTSTTSKDTFTTAAYGAAYIPVVAIGTQDGSVLISEDGGTTWAERKLTGGPVIAIAVQYGAMQLHDLYAATHEYIYHQFGGSIVWDSVRSGSFFWFDAPHSGDLRWNTQYIVGSTGEFALQPLLLRRPIEDTLWTRANSNIVGEAFTSVVAFPDTPLVYVCTSQGKIYSSNDSGNTLGERTSGTLHALHDLAFSNPRHGYAVGDNGGILTYHETEIPTDVEEPKLPNGFILHPNYPNPFNPSTEIRFELPVSGFVSLNIYNVLGQEVAILLNERKEAGAYTIRWNADRFPSGVYFCRMNTPEFQKTQLMMLVR